MFIIIEIFTLLAMGVMITGLLYSRYKQRNTGCCSGADRHACSETDNTSCACRK